MDRTAADTVTTALVAQINRQLQEAASITISAQLCAETGDIRGEVGLVMDIEDPV